MQILKLRPKVHVHFGDTSLKCLKLLKNSEKKQEMKTLYEQFVDKITYSLIENKLISAEDEDAYRFGTEVTLLKSVHFVSYLVIAALMEKAFEFLVVFVIFYSFRRNTGGFHCRTRLGCYLFSCTVVFLSLFATELSFDWWGMTVVSILDLIVLLILSPVQHINRKLDIEDIACFRRRLQILSLVFLIIYAITSGLGRMYLVELYTIGVTIVTLLTIMGKLQSIKPIK